MDPRLRNALTQKFAFSECRYKEERKVRYTTFIKISFLLSQTYKVKIIAYAKGRNAVRNIATVLLNF